MMRLIHEKHRSRLVVAVEAARVFPVRARQLTRREDLGTKIMATAMKKDKENIAPGFGDA